MQLKLPKNPYKDILTITVGLLALHFILKKRGVISHDVLFFTGIAVGILSLLSEFIAGKIIWAWYKLAEGLGFVSSRILLSTIFFLLLTPISLLYRLSKKDAMQLNKKASGSYYITREHSFTAKDLEKMW